MIIKTIKITEIEWDTFDEDRDEAVDPKELGLPEYIEITPENPQKVFEYLLDYCDEGDTVEDMFEKAFIDGDLEAMSSINEALSDWLSDTYEWCTNGFGIELA